MIAYETKDLDYHRPALNGPSQTPHVDRSWPSLPSREAQSGDPLPTTRAINFVSNICKPCHQPPLLSRNLNVADYGEGGHTSNPPTRHYTADGSKTCAVIGSTLA
ncbi:uncharacterized protein BDZ99DRAFT_520802 [Mytilinidion resinicola]|uniref:Uncharacterized protein n=1 Tax=Mytilinidion resinicola TaxID=574789 RepID=A0A6A6YNA0_9PEZI|nr:uncharacterized protein BDZ99DRAFT_520802 [Mytilinidion resinicola]KAF2809445.1 hypothetical protein BDZ99DRAFT_520802 [Mytilinidion resinicola]